MRQGIPLSLRQTPTPAENSSALKPEMGCDAIEAKRFPSDPGQGERMPRIRGLDFSRGQGFGFPIGPEKRPFLFLSVFLSGRGYLLSLLAPWLAGQKAALYRCAQTSRSREGAILHPREYVFPIVKDNAVFAAMARPPRVFVLPFHRDGQLGLAGLRSALNATLSKGFCVPVAMKRVQGSLPLPPYQAGTRTLKQA